MEGKVISVDFTRKTITISFSSTVVNYHTYDKVLINNAWPEDTFYVKHGREEDGSLITSTPPLISPRKEAIEFYLERLKLKTSLSWDKLTALSTSFDPKDRTNTKVLYAWKKNIVLRALRLICITSHQATKIAELHGQDNLKGVYERVIKQPLVYPFLPIDLCETILSYHGKKIPDFIMPPVKISREIYKKLDNGWVCTPERDIEKLFPDVSQYVPILQDFYINIDRKCFYYKQALDKENATTKGLIELASMNDFPLPELRENNLNPEQLEALKLCLTKPLACVKGYAGTGKSTLIGEIVHYLPGVVIVSFTGKAISRLRNLVKHHQAFTIHKLLYSDCTPQEIIIDEASMVSLPLMASLLSRYKLKRLILIGDAFQLPPIEYGRVFERLLSCDRFATAELSTVLRTKEDTILENSFKLRNGQLKEIIEGDSLQILPGDVSTVLQLVETLEEVTIITPYVRFLKELNEGCQKIYNKNKTFYTDVYNNKYYVGDRVMCTENDYDRDVFNGEEGIIQEMKVVKKKACLFISFPSGVKIFELKDEDDMSKISICYAMSVHKAQGSEYPNVIFFLEKRQHSFFLNQRMIYTALTRAKNKMYLVGSATEIEQACGRPISYVRDNIIAKLY